MPFPTCQKWLELRDCSLKQTGNAAETQNERQGKHLLLIIAGVAEAGGGEVVERDRRLLTGRLVRAMTGIFMYPVSFFPALSPSCKRIGGTQSLQQASKVQQDWISETLQMASTVRFLCSERADFLGRKACMRACICCHSMHSLEQKCRAQVGCF